MTATNALPFIHEGEEIAVLLAYIGDLVIAGPRHFVRRVPLAVILGFIAPVVQDVIETRAWIEALIIGRFIVFDARVVPHLAGEHDDT